MSSSPPRTPDRATSLWLLAQAVGMALLLCWPAPLTLASAAVGTPGGDIAKHVWNLWWAHAEVRDGVPGFATTLVNWPNGMSLYPIEPLHQALAAVIPASPIVMANLLAIGNVALIGIYAGWLGWLVTGSRRGALTTAALIQGSAFVAFTLHVGVGELRQVWWIPLGLGCLLRARETGAPGWFAALGVVLGLATISCFYHGFFLATAVSVYALVTLRADRRLLSGYIAAALVALLIVLPFARLFADTYGEDDASRTDLVTWLFMPFRVDRFAGAALDLADVFRDRSDERVSTRAVYAYTGGRYLGVVATGLAVAGMIVAGRRALPWLAVASVGLVLAVGTTVWWGGQAVALPFSLPLVWINRLLAWVAEPLNFPVRFVALVVVAIGVLGGLAVNRWRWAGALVPLAVLDVAMHDLVPWPRDTTRLALGTPITAPPGAVADLSPMLAGNGVRPSHASKEGAVLPSWIDADLRTRGIAAQIALDRPFQTVAVERQEMWALDGLLWSAALPLADALVTHQLPHSSGEASAWLLRHQGFGSVILTHRCGAAPEAAAAAVLDRVLGKSVSAGCFTLWTVPTVRGGDPNALLTDHASRLSRLPAPRLLAVTDGPP